MDRIVVNGAEMAVAALGLAPEEAPLQLVWAHGWGVDHRLMQPLAETTARRAANWLIDFPGFGQSPRPPADWGTREALAARFGSADYRNAGAMRPIFVKVVREDLSGAAGRVTCPVLLLYGAQDSETPPEFGQRYAKLMTDARYFELPGQDHYTVLGDGRHQVLHRLKEFLDSL
jgi:pimeloyl-ACP methyl ester carboxylesterase